MAKKPKERCPDGFMLYMIEQNPQLGERRPLGSGWTTAGWITVVLAAWVLLYLCRG